MNISVIIAHPGKRSFNHAIAQAAVEQLEHDGHAVSFHDLYEEHFDPLLTSEEILNGAVVPEMIAKQSREIANAEGIVIIHPNWWGQPPAILKGWVDRVLRCGVAYEFLENDSGEGVPHGLLKARAAIVFNTSNTETERERKVFGDPLELIWKNCIFRLCGVGTIHRSTFSTVITSTDAQRQQWLNQARKDVASLFPNQCTSSPEERKHHEQH